MPVYRDCRGRHPYPIALAMTDGTVRSAKGIKQDHPGAAPLPYLGELEGLRAAGAIAVMLTHIGFLSGATSRDVLPGLVARLDIGVAVFFVLSGFLLFRPYARTLFADAPPPSLRRYAARRVARIVPAAAAVLVGTWILVPAARSAPSSAWLANIFQLQAWRIEWDIPGLAQLWSLSTEVAFYALLPLIGWAFVRLGNAAPKTIPLLVIGLFLLPMLARIAYFEGWLTDTLSWTRTLPLTLDWFAYGITLALVVEGASRLPLIHELLRRSGTASLIVAGSVFWVLTTSVAGPYDLSGAPAWQLWVKHLGYGIVAALVVMPSALGTTSPLRPFLRSRVSKFLGRISYGIFLWHLPVIFWVRKMLDLPLFAGGFWLTLGVTSLVTLVLASLSWYLLESPIINAVRRRTR